MHIVPIFGLLLALVFAVVAFGTVVDLQSDISALTSGGIDSLTALFPAMWMLVLVVVGIGAVVVALKLWG